MPYNSPVHSGSGSLVPSHAEPLSEIAGGASRTMKEGVESGEFKPDPVALADLVRTNLTSHISSGHREGNSALRIANEIQRRLESLLICIKPEIKILLLSCPSTHAALAPDLGGRGKEGAGTSLTAVQFVSRSITIIQLI